MDAMLRLNTLLATQRIRAWPNGSTPPFNSNCIVQRQAISSFLLSLLRAK